MAIMFPTAMAVAVITMMFVGDLDPPIVMMICVIFDDGSGDHSDNKASKGGKSLVISMTGSGGQPNEKGCCDGVTDVFLHGFVLLNSPVQRFPAGLYSINFNFPRKCWAKCLKREKTGVFMSTARTIECEIEVPAPIEDVWRAWTTEEGVVSFFCPAANVKAEPGGPYEILFNLAAPAGEQGAEGMVFLALQAPHFLSFTWNAPPHLPEVRDQRTHVDIRLTALSESRTVVHLSHGGWGSGEQWDEAFKYFSRAWPRTVFPRLAYRFANGPVDWHNPPTL
jgi:uncharacterized protein YndB with AHSA1/START domain